MKNILLIVVVFLISCVNDDPFDGKRPSDREQGVSNAEVVEISSMQYDNTFKELYITWENALDVNFIGTEFIYTTCSGLPKTIEIMKNVDFPHAFTRSTLATRQPGEFSYRSIWKGKDNSVLYSALTTVSDGDYESIDRGETLYTSHKTPYYQKVYNEELDDTNDAVKLYNRVVTDNPKDFYDHIYRRAYAAMTFPEDPDYKKLDKLYLDFVEKGVAAITWAGPKITLVVGLNWLSGKLDAPIADVTTDLTGVLYHELTHTVQKGAVGTGKVQQMCFGEGGADASRYICGYISDKLRVTNGHKAAELPLDNTDPEGVPHPWLTPYSTSGMFMVWLRCYDGDFWRKFNHSTELLGVDWTFERAVKVILGEDKDIRELWIEYCDDVSREEIPTN